METLNLIDTFAEFKELKNIDRATMMSVLEDVFRNLLQKRYESDENFDIIINIDKGDFEIVPVLLDPGGWKAANKAFGGHLDTMLRDLNRAIAA